MFDDVADGTKVWLWLRKVAVIPSRTCGLSDLPSFLCASSAATERRVWMLVFHKHSSSRC